MSYVKEARSGAVGNTRLQAKYGAGSTPPRQHYASGGRVAGGDKLEAGAEVAPSGGSAKRSFAKSAKMRRKDGGRAKRADGGWTGEGDSGKALKEKAAASSARAEDLDTEATAQSISSGTLGAAGADALKRGRFGRGAVGMGALAAGQLASLYNSRKAREARKAGADANREGDKAEGRKNGGRAEGGWVGEGDSGKKLREEAAKVDADTSIASAVPLGIGTGLIAGGGPKAKLAGAALAATGVPSAVRMFKNQAKADRLNDEADAAEGRTRAKRPR